MLKSDITFCFKIVYVSDTNKHYTLQNPPIKISLPFFIKGNIYDPVNNANYVEDTKVSVLFKNKYQQMHTKRDISIRNLKTLLGVLFQNPGFSSRSNQVLNICMWSATIQI